MMKIHNKYRNVFFLLMMTSFFRLFGQVEKPTWSSDKVTEESYYTIGTQAYIYSVTPFMMYAVLYQTQQIPYEGYPNGVSFNAWTKVNTLANVKNSRTVMANVNTLYASTWLDLRKEPIILEIPEFGNRYYSVALQDAYMNHFSILGSRTIGGYGGKFMICGPDYNGVIPSGFTKIESPTPFVWMLMRIAPTYANEKEIEVCRKLQADVTITPLSQINNTRYNPSTYNEKLNLGVPDVSKDPLSFFEIVHQYMQINPPPKGEAALMALFRQIGFNPEQDFSIDKLTEPQRKGLLRAVESGKEMINTYITNGDNIYNGWTIQSKEMGSYGYSYLTRAALTMQSIGGFPWEEAIYVVGYKDIKGNELDGSINNYLLHFNKNEIPQVNDFWSLTMYELPSVMLYDNAINRYQMGPQIEEMKHNKDGSLDIYIQHNKPKEKNKQGNWLPSPAGKFVLSMRMYNPKSNMFQLDAHKVPLPGIQPIKK
ncbi:DUF1254 domain-containing protein [Flavobacterium sp. M31R6]|uniref:DUF1254 domain-containing protein n=1 Tax=Flavobacterium sp. M31R6 TaxID=2739062 RepID=UPI001567F8F4|nr:DUF1254 domain-containing protein [Flavobacterium sp. M31R6]QKJ64155.1 DUF1254 domain-containing protein [Flavobacterium sp. M31R6]